MSDTAVDVLIYSVLSGAAMVSVLTGTAYLLYHAIRITQGVLK